MKKKLLLFFSVFVLIQTCVFGQTRQIITLTSGWKFQKGDQTEAYASNFNDSKWESVSIPHDWAIFGPFDKNIDMQKVAVRENGERIPSEKTGRTGSLPFIGTGWYRIKLPLKQLHKDEKVILSFEGAMSHPIVYINGEKVGEWSYGYSYHYFDITKYLNKSENTLAVKLTNLDQASRWYPGAGLYRKVQLIIKNEKSIQQWGTNITTLDADTNLATVVVKTKVNGGNLSLTTDIIEIGSGKVVASDKATKANNDEFIQEIKVTNPKLWSPESPNLYKAISRLYDGNQLKDETSTNFGIRTISYTATNGFRLNGKTLKFKGVCLHHDLGPLGTATNKSALRRQLQILKDMGCNAIRTSHNMPSIEQLELCDEMGIMVMAESFDEWKKAKMKNGYHLYFDSEAERDIVNLVNATRNHPSIVMWCSGNEVPDQSSPNGIEIAKRLQDIFHREDQSRPVTSGKSQVAKIIKSGFGALFDVPGLNYHLALYDEANKLLPQGFILGSETASAFSSRGVYKFPAVLAKNKKYDDNQSSSYDLEYAGWGNLPDDDAVLQDDKPWVIGEFVWTGFDYLGEPNPYDTTLPNKNLFSRSSYFGICDLAGIPKDRYYLYRSRWNENSETLHILPHWNWKGREGETTPVFVYTNYPTAELFINGKSMGKQTKSNATPLNRYRLMWMDVKYEPGTIKVVAYDEKGAIKATKEIKTAGEPYKIVLNPDRKTLDANGEDISFVTVSVVDKNGIECPTATNQLNFKVTGAGTYRAACNGDATSLEQFHLPTMKLFSGKLVVLVQSGIKAGKINVEVSGKGLKGANLNLNSTSTDSNK